MRIAIFEPEEGGHHLGFVRHAVTEMLRRGWEIDLVVTDRVRRHPHFASIPSGPVLHTMADHPTPAEASDFQRIRDQFSRWSNYAVALSRLPQSPDLVWMVNLDQADLAIAIKGSPFGRLPFGGFLFGRHFHMPRMGLKTSGMRPRDRLAGWVFHRILRIPALRALQLVDETLVEYCERFRPRGWERVAGIADMAAVNLKTHDAPPRESLGLPPDAFVVLAYGALSLRKGVADLLAALPLAPPGTHVLLAGRQDSEVRALAKSDRVTELDRFIDDEDESRVFQACDAVWVGYRHWYGSSGVLVQAAAAGKPCLAMDEGMVGYLVERHGLGVTVSISDPSEVADGIRRLKDDPEWATCARENGAKFASGRSPEQFAAAICDSLTGDRRPTI